jgi:cytoskeletal protein CcmA (bactofilin family)
VRIWPFRKPGASRRRLTTFLDESSEIEGKCVFGGTVMLNGRCHGEITAMDTLIVGERGVVTANVRGGTVIVRGELVGAVVASERLELRGRARVVGDVEAPVLVVEEGARLEGHCRMDGERVQMDAERT